MMTAIENVDTSAVSNISAGIPVKNLWLLMLYASEFKYYAQQYSGTESIDEDVGNLVADVLCNQVEERLKRNLTYGYKRSSRELTRVRGKINTLETFSKQLLLKGRVSCTFDELSIDTPRNQYICAALNKLTRIISEKKIRLKCQKLHKDMLRLGVSFTSSSSYHPKNDRLGRHEFEDKKVLVTAELAFNLALINESVGDRLYPSPDKQKYWVRKLFEKAIAGFYHLKLDKKWKVMPGKIVKWPIEDASSLVTSLMPNMEYDIFLQNNSLGERIIIDTKYTSITKPNRFDQEKLRRDYIFQLYSYIRSQEKSSDPLSMTSTGMLLHPSVGVEFDERVTIQGHVIRFCTIDLCQSPNVINERLLSLLNT
jgi:5-methylcytosine-specific restriction enzyme subunit McrC